MSIEALSATPSAALMRAFTAGHGEVLVRRFARLAALGPHETALLREIASRQEILPLGSRLAGPGLPPRPRLILSGWACRCRALPDGRRQIYGFLLPGDIVGFGDRPLDEEVAVALGALRVADGASLKALLAGSGEGVPGIVRAVSAVVRLEEQALLDGFVRVGRLAARARVANLLLELHDRLAFVGLVADNRFSLPLTQEMMSDALGLSIVHVNRCLQQLRRENLIETGAGSVVLRDRRTLAALADYRPADPADQDRPAPRETSAFVE